MPSFADKARQAQQEKRSGRDEKDPADLSGAQEPDWDNPESWGGGGSGAGDSDSGNAGDSADDKQDQEQKPAASASPAPASQGGSRAPRRRGRPRGPERVPVTVRLLTSTDRKLTVAVEQTGLNPQSIVEDALEAYFRRLKIQDPGPESQGDVA
ncbi:hypothetical protein QFZ56_008080 [Streptomyces achromogenes]|uniref:Ribbon-helix-helix protein CopG domain-containing protein n=1 Tax=Streptomyces achromogenes TaxID=67255 RepID=A0ABU0QED3_STRAH|nr:hypothetical protein [Streptomyces achromogenes]MDQ0689034.1 hypothetical protein [Streptomyces achromogenes]